MAGNLNLGLALVLVGLTVVILVWVVLMIVNRPPAAAISAPPEPPHEASRSEEAVMVVGIGGAVQYLNPRAREWFGLAPGDPCTLEGLLPRVRPSNEFLEVCAAPGQKRLELNGRPVQATSYGVPGPLPQVLIAFRDLDLQASLPAGGSEQLSLFLQTISSFGEAVTASLHLEPVVLSILRSTARMLQPGELELKAWDAESRAWVAYQLDGAEGSTPGLVRSVPDTIGPLTQRLIDSRKPVFVGDGGEASGSGNPGVISYLGIPLVAGSELVGILEARQITNRPFTSQDRALLEHFAPQIAAALRNVMLYEQERRRTAEYLGLASLAQAVVAIREPKQLFTRLVASIAPLFDAAIIGFLLYDERRRWLEAQVPFRGLSDNLLHLYRTRISPGSPGERILQERRSIVTDNAAEDPDWSALGLSGFAVASSLRDSALIPLTLSDQTYGYLQVAHRPGGGAALSESEGRLLDIVAEQASAIIDNAILVRQGREQTSRSEALRRIGENLSLAETVEEALATTMRSLATLFKADVAAAYLLDETRGQVRLHEPSAVGVPPESARSAPSAVVGEADYVATVTRSGRSMHVERLSPPVDLPAFYRTLFGALKVECALVVPLYARGQAFGELTLGSREQQHFEDYDLALLTTAGASLSVAMDRLDNASHTDESLRRRVEQLTAVARVSRALGGTHSLDELLHVIHDEAIRASGADCGSILVADADNLEVSPHKLQSVGCPVGDSLSALERRALESSESFAVADFGQQQAYPVPHPGVRSALFVPVVQQGRAVGLIQVHAAQPDAFDEDALQTVQTLASQASVALNSARQMQEERRQSELLRRRAATLEQFSTAGNALDPGLPLEDSLRSIAEGVRESTPFRIILISVYEPDTGMFRRVSGAGIDPETLAELRARKQQLSILQQLAKPEFKISHSYYIPADQTPVLPADIHYVYASQYSEAEARQNAWDPDDFLLVPLEDSQGNPVGLISLDDPANGLRPDRATIETVELFAAQAAQVIGNYRRIGELSERIKSLSSGLARQQQLLSVTQNDLPVLLRKDLEQTMALHSLDQRARRVRAGLSIAEAVGRQLDASSALMALGRETLTQLGMSMALIAENTAEGSRLMHVLGAVPSTLNVEALFGQRNPLRAALQQAEPILVANLEDSEQWRDSPLLTQLRAKGIVCLPLVVENRPLAAMLAASVDPLPAITEEDRQVYLQVARQASVVLQNISLLNETRRRLNEVNILLDFSRRLTGLDPGQLVRALLDSARQGVSAAHAGIVFLWDEPSQTLVPRAASGYADDESMLGIAYHSNEALPAAVFSARKPRRVDEVQFARDYVLPPVDLDLYRTATGGRLPVSSLLLPIVVEEQAIGLILLDNFNTAAAFKAEDEALLLSLSQQAALSLENVRLFGETQRLAHEMEQRVVERTAQLSQEQQNTETVLRILTEVSASLDLDRALDRTLSLLSDAVSAEQGTIMLLNAEDGLLHFRAGYGRDSAGSAPADRDSTLEIGEGLPGWVVQNREAALVKDFRKDSRWVASTALGRDFRSAVVAPLLVADEVIGALIVASREVGHFSNDSLALVGAIGNQVAVAINNARLYELIQNQAERLGLMLRKEQEEASRSQAILESVADGVLVTGSDNLISFVNDSVARILGSQTAALLGQPVSQIAEMFGEPGRGWLAAVEDWSEASAEHGVGNTYAERVELSGDRIALIHAAPVVLGQDFLGTVSILRDITHEVEVDRLKSEFVATVSHELRTPLTAIKGYVEMLTMGAAGAVSDSQSHFLAIVKNNTDRLNALVDDLLDVSRIESGKIILAPQELDLEKIAADVIAEMRKASEDDHKLITFSLKASRSVGHALGDPERVRQIVHTLVENAYHYTPENGSVQINLRSLASRSEVQVEVVDTGVGISKSDQGRLFERFFRGEDPLVLATPGTGLGLSIARQLVEMHHGTISAKSDGVPGHGSTFSFTLPAFPAAGKASSAARRGSRSASQKRPGRSGTGAGKA